MDKKPQKIKKCLECNQTILNKEKDFCSKECELIWIKEMQGNVIWGIKK